MHRRLPFRVGQNASAVLTCLAYGISCARKLMVLLVQFDDFRFGSKALRRHWRVSVALGGGQRGQKSTASAVLMVWFCT
jgi:hypothetical protein